MHGSLEDGNTVEEANDTPEGTDDDGIIVVTVTGTEDEGVFDIFEEVGFV